MKIVLTGKMSQTRDEEFNRFKNYGITVMREVTSTTDYLVTGVRSGKAKMRAAAHHGTTIMTEEDFFQMLVDTMPEYLL